MWRYLFILCLLVFFRDAYAEDKASEDKASEDKASEDKASEDKASEDKAPEDKGPEVKPPADKLPEEKELEVLHADQLEEEARANEVEPIEPEAANELESVEPEAPAVPEDVHVNDAIKDFEEAAYNAVHFEKHGHPLIVDIPDCFETMAAKVANITDLLKDSRKVYKFIELRGIDRVIVPYLHYNQTSVRTNLLNLTQLLFDVAPMTTSAVMPLTTLGKLLNIFETDDNMTVKARTMYIFYAWLPENPRVQARVMQIKGLEPFYEQMHKLDAAVINTQMRLISKIIKEHIRARNSRTISDEKIFNTYIKMGLLEKLRSDNLCHGLFIIFTNIWKDKGENQTDTLYPVFEIITDIEPYCNEKLKGTQDAVETLVAMYEYIARSGEATKLKYEGLGLNTTELKLVLNKYIIQLSPPFGPGVPTRLPFPDSRVDL
ncbi:hypothetical protein O0L34_g14065 [Tuta absoluta]|nr:hypothetical protein O0L34_g14065 [Tuta absoluta]